MDDSVGGILIILGIGVFVWVLPILIIMASGKTTRTEKIMWLVAVLFISWFAWILYMFLAPIKRR